MTIKKSTVSQIQKAGQAMHDAAQLLSKDAQVAGEVLHQKMSAELHDPTADELYAQWKSLAGMVKDLVQMEEKLKLIYASCMQSLMSAGNESSVVRKKPLPKAQSRRAGAAMAPSTQGKRKPGRPPKKPLAQGVVGTPKAGNEQRLMEHLQQVLNPTEMLQVPHLGITAATGIPAGSISATIRRLVAKNLLVAGSGGALRLAGQVPVAQPASPSAAEAPAVIH